MAEKKKSIKKIKTASVPKIEPEVVIKEKTYPVIEIAQMLNVSSFNLFVIKQETGISDGSFLTISEFSDMYNKIIKGR